MSFMGPLLHLLKTKLRKKRSNWQPPVPHSSALGQVASKPYQTAKKLLNFLNKLNHLNQYEKSINYRIYGTGQC